jgi:hypothetical protein
MDTTSSQRSTRTRRAGAATGATSFARNHSEFSDDSLDTMHTSTMHDNQDANVEIGSLGVSQHPSSSPSASPQAPGPRKRTAHACDNCRNKKARVSLLAIAPYH